MEKSPEETNCDVKLMIIDVKWVSVFDVVGEFSVKVFHSTKAAVGSVGWLFPLAEFGRGAAVRLKKLSLCSRCWRHIWLCWIVSRLQDPATLTISDAMKAMFVAMVCTKLADLYGILGNISAVCHTFHWKQHSPEFQLCILPLQGLKSQRTSSSFLLFFNSWHLAYTKTINHMY